MVTYFGLFILINIFYNKQPESDFDPHIGLFFFSRLSELKAPQQFLANLTKYKSHEHENGFQSFRSSEGF